MSQQPVRQSAPESALDAHAILTGNARLDDSAVDVLTAIGEREGAVLDAEQRAGEALRAMTRDEVRHMLHRQELGWTACHDPGDRAVNGDSAVSADRHCFARQVGIDLMDDNRVLVAFYSTSANTYGNSSPR
jgi:hypothetical protein